MLYIVGIINGQKGNTIYYSGFETCSNSSIILDPTMLKEIILSTKIKVANAKIKNNNIVITDWVNAINVETIEFEGDEVVPKYTGAKYVLISRSNNTYKISDNKGYATTVWEAEMRDITETKEVANCSLNGNSIEATDIYETISDKEFEKLIAYKYDIFKAKAAMLGYKNITFEYEIENHEVKLKMYTGQNKNIIVPPFITTIMKDAFSLEGIKTIKLSEGLKIIGTKAFSYGELERIEIPSTVELIGTGAFGHNGRLFDGNGFLNTDRFKLRNENTIVLNQN